MISKRTLCIDSAVHLSLRGKLVEIHFKEEQPDTTPEGLTAEESAAFHRYFPQKHQPISLEDLAIVVADNPATSYSSQLLAAFAEYGVSLVVCDGKHLPSAVLLPMVGHFAQSKIMRAQVAMTEPTKKRLWQKVVRAKIGEQAQCLAQTIGKGDDYEMLLRLQNEVLSGDSSNTEGLCAQYYWRALFGDNFYRMRAIEKNAPPTTAAGVAEPIVEYGNPRDMAINGCLNYGYSIIRSMVARSVVAVGLHPGFGLFHKNQFNPFGLVDDLIEPFRALVDEKVWRANQHGVPEIRYLKPVLINLVHEKILWSGKRYPLMFVAQKMVEGFRQTVVENTAWSIPPLLSAIKNGDEHEFDI